MSAFGLAIHGGAGTISKESMTSEQELEYKNALKEAIRVGYDLLSSGASALDAVEQAVKSLEDCPLFNAGKGSVFNSKGGHEMDAAIMDGKTLKAGAVTLVSLVRNPVELARKVMEESEHVLLGGDGAIDFARMHDIQFEDEKYFYSDFRHKQWLSVKDSDQTLLDHTDKKFGTVGAVALDKEGNLAAATSTGGMTNKKFGRIGDTPIIGAGTYSNNLTCAVSCTGSGEYFIRGVTAYDVSCLMEYKGLSLEEASREVVMNRLVKLGGDGGLIAIDAKGNVSALFNTSGMYRGYRMSNGRETITIYQ